MGKEQTFCGCRTSGNPRKYLLHRRRYGRFQDSTCNKVCLPVLMGKFRQVFRKDLPFQKEDLPEQYQYFRHQDNIQELRRPYLPKALQLENHYEEEQQAEDLQQQVFLSAGSELQAYQGLCGLHPLIQRIQEDPQTQQQCLLRGQSPELLESKNHLWLQNHRYNPLHILLRVPVREQSPERLSFCKF